MVEAVGESLEPHRLASYLYGVASLFSSFYEHCPVLGAADSVVRDGRLVLCDLALRVFAGTLSSGD